MVIGVRVTSGIPGLDQLMEGGFLENSVNLVTGETGTGKTTFCLQFLWEGLQKGETCVYITLEQSPEDIKEDAAHFGWDFTSYEKKGLCRVIYHDPAQVNNLGVVIVDEIKSLKAKRLIVDSTSLIGLSLDSKAQVRKMLINLVNVVKKAGCTALLISEIEEDSKGLSRYGVEEFVVDGIIRMNYLEYASGDLNRSLIIRKMRRTNHGADIYPTSITKKGFVVKKNE